ncbi:MAG: PHP domain-containing protein [Clostridia bacterium]|nr:PHP domain-containing protein [Clostridia bacterium]
MKFFSETTPWYKANFHTHTTVSDGRKSPEEVEGFFRAAGYDIVAFSDHRKVSPAKIEKDFILLSATELDTLYGENRECFHIIGLNIPADATFGDLPKDSHPQAFIDRIRQLGGIAFLAHPQWSLNQPEDIVALKGIFAVEVYNTASTLPNNADRADSSQILDLVARKGHLIPQIATDDCHWYTGEHCRSYTMVQAEDFSVNGILDALKKGRFYASQGPRINQVEIIENTMTVSCSECVTAIFYSNSPWVGNRSKITPEGATEYTYQIQPADRFVRVELIDKDGNKAWLSPFAVNGAENKFKYED